VLGRFVASAAVAFKRLGPYQGIVPATVELGKEALPTLSR